MDIPSVCAIVLTRAKPKIHYTGNVKPATKGAYEEHIRVHIKPYLGEVKLAKLTAPMVQNVYNTLLEEKVCLRSPSRIFMAFCTERWNRRRS